MVTSQEIIERSFYHAMLSYTLQLGLTLDPNKYEKSEMSMRQYDIDKKQIQKTKGRFITVLGSGNNQSKGMKDLYPIISVEPQGFIPGNVGINKFHLEKAENSFVVSETPFEAIDQYIDIRLSSKNMADARLLNLIMNYAIPQRGYLKPYLYDKAPFSGNIFILASNFYNEPNEDRGIIEKVYTWEVQDTLLTPPKETGSETPIIDIEVDLLNGQSELPIGNLHIV